MIDAYCHVGLPRFGTAVEALDLARVYGIQRSVFALGPRVPDFATLFDAIARFGDRVRGVGVPLGDTAERRREMVACQIEAGVMGMRMQVNDLTDDLLTMLGEAERWVYAMFIFEHDTAIHTLINWLEKYPKGRVAAPHFIRMIPHKVNGVLKNLVEHPRFFPILSRQGNDGAADPYPHVGLKPWVEQVIDLAGWDRVMWASEYPIIHWRNERMSDCQNWLKALLGDVTGDQLAQFGMLNAQREMFDYAPPSSEDVTIPKWVDELWDRSFPVPLFETHGFELSMDIYAKLHEKYVVRLKDDPELTFEHFARDLISEIVS